MCPPMWSVSRTSMMASFFERGGGGGVGDVVVVGLEDVLGEREVVVGVVREEERAGEWSWGRRRAERVSRLM